jgi:hypothetical protein
MALTSPEGLEEERRLFYVALTRARRQLHLYVPTRYYHHPHAKDDLHGYGTTSRFLTDELRATLQEGERRRRFALADRRRGCGERPDRRFGGRAVAVSARYASGTRVPAMSSPSWCSTSPRTSRPRRGRT